ncbi:MAG: sensor histidine kinase [Terriglobales bacterium]
MSSHIAEPPASVASPKAEASAAATNRTTLPLPVLTNSSQISYAELLAAFMQLEEENHRSTVALASAAHELKTPLAVMSGYLELLLSEQLGPLSGRQRQVLQAMQSSGTRLQSFIQDFLTYAALDTGKLKLDLKVGDLNAALAELAAIWSVRFQQHEVALYFPANQRLRCFAFDYHKVQRVVSNLLENAYAWTPRGGSVWLTAEPHFWERRGRELHLSGRDRRRAGSSEPNAVRVTVSDTGPGIAPEFHQEIFEEFFSMCPPGQSSGSGLGLAIARRLVQAQHGKIWLESEPGAGSKFSFLLPCYPVQEGN